METIAILWMKYFKAQPCLSICHLAACWHNSIIIIENRLKVIQTSFNCRLFREVPKGKFKDIRFEISLFFYQKKCLYVQKNMYYTRCSNKALPTNIYLPQPLTIISFHSCYVVSLTKFFSKHPKMKPASFSLAFS